MKQPSIYIITNKRNGTLYIGVTSNLVRRIYEHKEGIIKGFSSRYNCKILVYYESFDNMEQAIIREKQLKSVSRKKKIKLIESLNPKWQDQDDLGAF